MFELPFPEHELSNCNALIFSRAIRPEKNREIFGILKKHKLLSSRHLQKQLNVVLTKTAEIGKASAVAAAMADRESRNVFEEFDHGFQGFPGFHERFPARREKGAGNSNGAAGTGLARPG
jgi:hypothetical protein